MVFLPKEKKLPKKREKPSSVGNINDEATTASFPIRDHAKLFCASTTLQCALTNCVPCGYKIGLFDVALDKDFTKCVPNQRPEQCPRLKSDSAAVDGTMGFRCGMKVLTVGDGDFSFSLAVARIVNTKPESQQRVIATSYESEATLRNCYPNFDEIVDEMKTRNVTIAYQVDATSIEDTLLSKLKDKKLPKFDRIIWNMVGSSWIVQIYPLTFLERRWTRNPFLAMMRVSMCLECHQTQVQPFNLLPRKMLQILVLASISE